MKQLKFLLPVLLAAAVVGGCGGGGSAAGLKGGDVAVVGTTHVTKPDYDTLLAQAKRSFTQQGQKFPKQGTPEFETVKSQVMRILITQAERAQKAPSMGIHVTDKQVATQLKTIKQRFFGGSAKKYEAQLKQQHLTDAQVHESVRAQLIYNAIVAKVTGGIKVSSADVHQYYLSHSQVYAQPQSRDVRYVLVKSKPLAQQLYAKLKNANTKTWCAVAKKYSQDPSSKATCGKAHFARGQTVPEFDNVLFTQKTKQVHAPVHNKQYGWFVIQPLTNITPRKVTPEKQVAPTIKQQLIDQQKNQALTDWSNKLTKSFCSGSKVRYQVGYKPTPDPCAATTTTNATTT